MKNNKGFVLTETLVVTVFLITIFTFIYVSIVPLIGNYDDMTYRDADIDIVYKLYNIRKMINNDENKRNIVSGSIKRITCADLTDVNYCNKVIEYLELDNYILVYTNNIRNNLNSFKNYDMEMYNYISKYQDLTEKVLVLLDKDTYTISHLVVY